MSPVIVPSRLPKVARKWFPLVLLAIAVGEGLAEDRLDWDVVSDRVTADLAAAPLPVVLERIRLATGWEVAVEPGVNEPVSTVFKELNSGEALPRLLRVANFALIQRTNQPPRLLVFRTSMDHATKAILEQGADSGDPRAIEDELIVTLKPGSDAAELAHRLGAKVVGSIDALGAYRLKFEDAAAARAGREALEQDPAVDRIDQNYSINRPEPLQSMISPGAALPSIKPTATGDGRLIVGVVDTAVQVPQGDLGRFFLPGIAIAGEYQPEGAAPTHGTGMSSDILNAIAAMVGEGSSVNVSILPVDVFGAGETTSTFQLGQGMVEAWNNGATLINGSIGSKAESAWLNEVIDRLSGYGALIVAPSGNTPDGLPTYPAANPNVLAVTAVGPDGRLAPYANMAPFVDVAMPGSSIVSLTGSPYFMSGTSVATARATGAVAGFMLRYGQPLTAGRDFLLRTRGVPPGAQISP